MLDNFSHHLPYFQELDQRTMLFLRIPSGFFVNEPVLTFIARVPLRPFFACLLITYFNLLLFAVLM